MHRQLEIHSRNDYIKNLNGFLMSAKSFLGETLQKLNWTESATVVKSDDKPLVTCPLNSGHRVTCDNVDKHVELCQWHQLGYRDDDIPFPPPPTILPITSVVIDKTLQREIILKAAQKDPSIKIGQNVQDREVPQTSDRFFSDFTTDERRILYDHVVSKTARVVPQLKEFNLTMKPEGQSAPMTREQLLAAERDAKRRRVKHRAAKVHTKSKNYSEVLRAVITNQMVAYEDWIKENFGNVNPSESTEPENKNTVEAKREKQEMVWLDWDYRSNPHTRWKHILEKERRRKEREEKDAGRSGKPCEKETEKTYHERKRNRDESTSRRHNKGEFRKCENDDKLKRENYHHEASFSGRRRNELEKGRYEIRNESIRKESHYSRHRGEKYEEERLRTERYKRSRYEKDYKSKYKEKNTPNYGTEYKSEYKEKNSSKYEHDAKGSEKRVELYSDERYVKSGSVRIREGKSEDLDNCSYSYNNKYCDSLKIKKEEDSESGEIDSASDSSQSYSSRESRTVKKRKKSKKKHKHKHKKKHRKEHS